LNDPTAKRNHNPERYALFIGCTVAYKLPHIEAASRYVMDALDLQPVDLPFSCCPDPNGAHSYSSELWYTLAARNLALAESQALDIVTLCSGCYSTLKHCRELLKNDTRLRKQVNQKLKTVGRRFSGQSRVFHFYQLLYERIGYERLRQLVAKPLNDLKIAVHYGCHCLRPKQMNPPEDPEHPQWLWQFVEQVLGAETVHYLDETQCCGAGLREMNRDISLDLTRRKIRQMEQVGANAILVPCPTCYLQFDAGQRLLLRQADQEINGTAVFYQAELLAIAMGAKPESIGIQFHMIKPDLNRLKVENANSGILSPTPAT
jgi:heterodisulfide reductase subunit B